MIEMFNLDKYKSYLIEFYYHRYDEDKLKERKDYINNHYTDNYLTEIINNTQQFILLLLDKMKNDQHIYKDNIFCEMELLLSGEIEKYISNGCCGGWPSDRLFHLGNEDTLISKFLIENFFGKKFRIELNYKEIDCFNSREQAGSSYETPIFYISGQLDEFNKIYDQYILNSEKKEKHKELVMVLKQIRNKK